MKITIKRQTGLGGSAMRLAVYIDGEKVGALANGEVATYPIQKDHVDVRVGQGFITSKPLTLQAGQTAVAKFSLIGNLFSILGRSSFYLELEEA